MFGTVDSTFWFFPISLFPFFFGIFLSQKASISSNLPLTRLACFFLVIYGSISKELFSHCQQNLIPHLSFLVSAHKRESVSLFLKDSVSSNGKGSSCCFDYGGHLNSGFFPWCSSNGFLFDQICMVNKYFMVRLCSVYARSKSNLIY